MMPLLSENSTNMGTTAKQSGAFQWSHRQGQPEKDYQSDCDSHRDLTIQEQDEALARQLEQEQEQTELHPPVVEVAAFSEQDHADDAEARRQLATTSEDSSYAAALQRGSVKQYQTRAADQAQFPVAKQQLERTDSPPARRHNSRPLDVANIDQMKASIQAAERNLLKMQVAKQRTIEIPPQVSSQRPVRPPPSPVHVTPMKKQKQLDYGHRSDDSDEAPAQHEPAQQLPAQLSVQHAAPRTVTQNKFAPIECETQSRPTQQPPRNSIMESAASCTAASSAVCTGSCHNSFT